MQQKDARQILREDLQKFIGEAPATIGVLHRATYFYTAMPAAQLLNSERVAVRVQDAGQNADFLLVGFPTEIDSAQINATVQEVEAQGKFKYAKGYRVPVRIWGCEFRLMHFPQDMTYPFPTILLFRARTAT